MSDNLIYSGNFTLEQFTDLAEQSRDRDELRISRSSSQLTNTPLGLISRTNRSVHKKSNLRATQAFMSALINDPRYQSIRSQLEVAPLTHPREGKALTPALIRQTIATANSMLCASKLSACLDGQGFFSSPAQRQEFESFARDYLKRNGGAEIDFGDYGANPGQDAQRQSTVIGLLAAYLAEGTRLEETGALSLPADLAQGDAEKGALLSGIISRHLIGAGNRERAAEFVAKALSSTGIPSSGPFLGGLKGALGRHCLELFQGSGGPVLARLGKAELASLSEALEGAEWQEVSARDLLGLVTGALEDLEALTARMHPGAEVDRGALLKRLLSLAAMDEASRESFQDAVTEVVVEGLVASPDLRVDGQPVLGQDGLGEGAGRLALQTPTFMARAKAALAALPPGADGAADAEAV
ncbi:MAG: hypothetical protein K6A65_00065, partial [Succinivibrionaceae bacterium]|nr:hypothetical protein [Succinivibrionaceae bacterium]